MSTVEAKANCVRSNNREWNAKHTATLRQLYDMLPSGSGIDNGTKVDDVDQKRLRLVVEYHHMNENGMYDGWTTHVVRVTPGWHGIEVKVSGPNRGEINDYLHDVYYHALTAHVECDVVLGRYRFAEVTP
jgi:hypothetical protein